MKFKHSPGLLSIIALTIYIPLFNTACDLSPSAAATAITDTIPFASLPQHQVTIDMAESENFVNVMGDSLPSLPSFPKLSKKANTLRGYVKNRWGQPLVNAYIGVRSSAIGGAYSMASARTDSKGYYEMELPFGTVHYFSAGYSLKYGPGIAALGLYPADGEAESFASKAGGVENFVLLPYGYGNLEAVSEKPWYPRNYFGGTVSFDYSIKEDMWSSAGSLPPGSTIEITLTPDGFLVDASEKRIFIIRKKTGNVRFSINNIPAGKYKIAARLSGGKALKLKTTGMYQHPTFGLRPVETTGNGQLLFTPYGAEARSAMPNLGGWTDTNIKLELPG